ncbi:MAG: hypothetical protein ACR2NZ_17265 [Rubripirellula sp.]
MNLSTLGKLVFATCMVACTAINAQAQGLNASQLLYGGTSCDHVIRLIHIHGVNNSFDVSASLVSTQFSPAGPIAVPHTELGDLEIVQVAQVQHADIACGPKFNVTIRNNSCRDVCNFHVSVVAALGRICPSSPNATACVEKICAGQAVEVCVQLPIEALAMGNRNGQVIGFQRLVVAIDSFDVLAETNEANNLKAFACHEIPIATAVVTETASVTTTETVTEGANPAVAPAAVTPNGAAPAPSAAPATPAAPAAQADPLRSAIRMMDQPATEAVASTQ